MLPELNFNWVVTFNKICTIIDSTNVDFESLNFYFYLNEAVKIGDFMFEVSTYMNFVHCFKNNPTAKLGSVLKNIPQSPRKQFGRANKTFNQNGNTVKGLHFDI